MLVHTECGGEVVTDKGKPPVVTGGSLWYFVKCLNCGQPLGTLADVEDFNTSTPREQDYVWRRAQSH